MRNNSYLLIVAWDDNWWWKLLWYSKKECFLTKLYLQFCHWSVVENLDFVGGDKSKYKISLIPFKTDRSIMSKVLSLPFSTVIRKQTKFLEWFVLNYVLRKLLKTIATSLLKQK